MAKRFYICDIVTRQDDFMGAINEPSVAAAGVNFSVVYPAQDASGAFTRPVCLVVVNAVNHARLIADARNRALPDAPLDVKINAVRTATTQAMEAMLQAKGFTLTWSQSDGYRDVIRGVGRQLDPNFNEDSFDVSE